MKIIYLGACLARFERNDCLILYNDIDPYFKPDLLGDMLDVDLTTFDAIIATPPCNYYSKANYRRETSEYAQKTKHLLPFVIHKCFWSRKPFIVENVRNSALMQQIFNMCACLGVHVYFKGRHTYFTNIELKLSDIPQEIEYIANKSYYTDNYSNYRQGGKNIELVFNRFIDTILKKGCKI